MAFAYLHECFPDPTKTFVYREVAAMQALGMEPVVFSIRRPSEEEKSRMEALEFAVRYFPPQDVLRTQIDGERASLPARHRRALSHWRQAKGDSNRIFEALWLGRELRRLGVRHVHAHFAGLAARTAWLVRELWGIGFSFTGHADDIFSPEQKPITLQALVRDARLIATETAYSARRLEEGFAKARGKTFVVHNGIAFQKPVQRQPSQPPRIVSVGRMVEKKGFLVLLDACARLRQAGFLFHCDLIGGGPLEREVAAGCERLGLEACVTMHGAQPQSFVQNRLHQASLFALAAKTEGDGGSDNLPTVIMEAMAVGLPVVSTHIAGIPEMVDDGETGALVSPDDPRALAGAIQRYLEEPARAVAHGIEAMRRARERFDVHTNARKLAQLLVHHCMVKVPQAAVARAPELQLSAWQQVCRFLKCCA